MKFKKFYQSQERGRKKFRRLFSVPVNSKRVISKFSVGDDRQKQWISKTLAVTLAEAGRLHAIVVHTKTDVYLRPEYHSTPFKQLIVPSTVASIFLERALHFTYHLFPCTAS